MTPAEEGVLIVLRRDGPATDEEIWRCYQLCEGGARQHRRFFTLSDYASVLGARIALTRDGYIVDTALRRERSPIWRATTSQEREPLRLPDRELDEGALFDTGPVRAPRRYGAEEVG